jgi:DNA-binding response OmpR family regulator
MSEAAATILLIEDDLDTRDIMARFLSGEGYSVRIAANGWEGLLATESHVDLILLDIMLPGMDGVSFLKSLRGHAHGKGVPVVVITAKDPGDVLPQVQPYGVKEVLVKNQDVYTRLNGVLKRLLKKPRPHARVTLPQPGSLVRPYLDVYLRILAWN